MFFAIDTALSTERFTICSEPVTTVCSICLYFSFWVSLIVLTIEPHIVSTAASIMTTRIALLIFTGVLENGANLRLIIFSFSKTATSLICQAS